MSALMSMSKVAAKLIGGKLGGALKVPVEDGIMFPFVWKYAEKIKELAHEKSRVSPDYLKGLIEEARKHHDFTGLQTIYNYMSHQAYSKDLFDKIIKYGQELKLHEWMHDKFGNPFAMAEMVVRHLC